MRVLALDTTTRDGSVALVDDAQVVDERRGDRSRTHAERLPGEIVALLEAERLTWNDIDLFAVASGPGSFTGLRIGIATVQGLALTTGRSIVAPSALEALAQCVSANASAGGLIAAWMDAHRGDVFSALFRVTTAPIFEPERVIEVEGPRVGDPAATLARWAALVEERATLFVGGGADRYRETIERISTSRIVETPLLAGGIGRMAIARARRGEMLLPAAVQPLYVRRPDAVLERERKSRERKEN
jgi:tRNA threonylcarbamoyladenosine biosynthesis protein TsaB